MTRVYIGLGTNLGDRAANLEQARRSLAGALGSMLFSRVYESEPVGVLDQPLFLNQAAAAETALPPMDLLRLLKGIEAGMGRVPSVRNGPRLIDLDLIYYGDWIMAAEGLVVPHPRRAERSFVLAPLTEIAPGFRDPMTGETVAGMWREREKTLARSWVFE